MGREREGWDFAPSAVVEICFPLFRHYAIATDRYHGGRPTLIGLSYRTGAVTEDSWQVAVGDRPVRHSDIRGTLPAARVIERARACVGQPEITWNLLTCNCEHFVRAVHGLPIKSTQVRSALGGAILGMAAVVATPHATLLRVLCAAPCGALLRMRHFAHNDRGGWR